MGRIEKMKRLIIEQANKRILGEDIDTDADLSMEIDKAEELFNNIKQKIESEGCWDLNEYPYLYELVGASLCAVIIVCIIIATEGLSAPAIAGIAWAVGCALDDIKELQALAKEGETSTGVKTEAYKLLDCMGIDYDTVKKVTPVIKNMASVMGGPLIFPPTFGF